MRLATRALIAALATLVLCAVVSGQTLRSPEDPRNLSPAVGTGGPPGGPTGLFTIYDGQTIRRGEFTFSIAYSNFDRDPGDVDIVEVPLSFNIGLNDHIELFFKTTGFRGVKPNSPANLSSFYLPNSQLHFGPPVGLGSGPAIVLAPTGNVGTLAGTAVFRPAFNQPFVQFPFVGGSAGAFNTGPGHIGAGFGFPGFNAVLGPANGGTSTFGAAAAYPGIGSPVGSILPGVVLATQQLPPTLLGCPAPTPANPNPTPCIVPATFTIAPAFLPEAPFINRLYGESSFNDLVFGAKIRLTGPNNPFGFGFVPFYRWWMDKGDSFGGFNQMQRGSGGGGDIGDFGLVMFADGRLSEHVNLSANIGYILNSNPKDPNGFVMLDRPDELLAGVGIDLPLTSWFQLIGEVKSVQYMGGTPNAFNNNPVDALAGFKLYPRRWFGFGFAYRRHLNPQDVDRFEPRTFNVTVNQITNVNPAGPQPLTVIPATTVPATDGSGRPRGFRFSEDPHGYIVQFFIGHRNARIVPVINVAPVVSVSASSASITTPCPPGTSSDTCTPSASRSVELTANATDADNDTLLYTWSVTGGTLSGEGRTVNWDLSGVNPGTYTASVEVNDGNQHLVSGTTTVTVAECTNCRPPCPTVSVSCPSDVELGQPITFTSSVSTDQSVTYNWSVSAGTISSGQGTSSITVDTTGLGGQTVTATLELGGLDPACSRTASCSTSVSAPPPGPTKFDEYGDIRFNDEKARLDNYAIQLQNSPGAQGYIIAYGNCEGAAQARADRAKDYLVNTRGIDAGRIVTIDGGCRADLMVELWIVPTGATPPTADASSAVDPCPQCRTPRRRTRRDE
ncbi:MAG TPA: hypothetical protein VJV03_00410 [Pyrinomonadaceae bacterium]|nr:hypothetical protein [Pyrinomonadaceae bacterium]